MRLRSHLAHLFHPRNSNQHRPRILHPEGYAAVALVVTLVTVGLGVWRLYPTQLSGWVLGYATSISTQEVIDQTNVVRAQAGLSSTVYDQHLSAAAQAKAKDMFAHQYWAHISPTGKQPWVFIKESGYHYQAAGENLARDFSQTNDMMAAWMNSATHRKNILNPKYTQIGVAVMNGSLKGVETTVVVQLFGRPASDSTAQIGTGVSQQAPITTIDQAITRKISFNQAKVAGIASQIPPSPLASPLVTAQLRHWQQLSPSLIIKAIALGGLCLLILVLLYDLLLSLRYEHERMVGQNLAHLLYLSATALAIIWYRVGVVH